MKSIIFIITFNVLSVSIAFSQAGWIQQETGLNCDFNSVFFINESIGWTVGGRNIDTGVILKTMDSGSNWFVQVHGTYGMLYSVFFVDQNTGYTAGSRFYSGRIYKTTDGGTSWIDITPPWQAVPRYFEEAGTNVVSPARSQRCPAALSCVAIAAGE